jgi:hypothetical protein
MSADELETGTRWIDQTLSELATAAGLPVENLGWHVSTEDFKASRHSLVVVANGTRRVLTFKDEDLEDIPGDSGVQSGVESYLRSFVQSETVRA